MRKKTRKSLRKLSLLRWSQRRWDNYQEEIRHKERANWSELVPEITFVLLKCAATRERAHITEIGAEAIATYPGNFETSFAGRKIPDYSLILLALEEAKRREWGYAAGNWFKGWRLTRKGAAFARDVHRRRDLLNHQRVAA